MTAYPSQGDMFTQPSSAALTKAIEEKAGSLVRSLTKADIAKLLAPTLEGVEP